MIVCCARDQKEYTILSGTTNVLTGHPYKKSRGVYRITMFMPNKTPTCECIAFCVSQNRTGGKNHGGSGQCKHLDMVRDAVCDWTLDANIVPAGFLCPNCHGPVRHEDDINIPLATSEEDAVASLANLIKSLEQGV